MRWFKKLRLEITRPFTRSNIKKLDNSLRESLDECNNQEQQALAQLRQQQALEHAAIAAQRNIAQQNIQNESNRFLSHKTG